MPPHVVGIYGTPLDEKWEQSMVIHRDNPPKDTSRYGALPDIHRVVIRTLFLQILVRIIRNESTVSSNFSTPAVYSELINVNFITRYHCRIFYPRRGIDS